MVNDIISKKSNQKPFFGYIKEDFITMHLSMMLRKHSPLNSAFIKKIDQLIESGIVNRFVEAQFAESTKIKNKQNEEEKQEKPEQLTMEHLELSFYAVLIGLTLSCVVFVVELLIGLLRR
jgi:chromatin remodeling complex protein RSC6